MGKTRDLFKKIRDIKGIFHAKMGSIKERNGMDLTEAEDIKMSWQEYTELYKKDLHDPDNHDPVTLTIPARSGVFGKYFLILFSIIINPCERIALHFQRGDFKF